MYNYLNLLNADIGGDIYTEKDLCIFANFYYQHPFRWLHNACLSHGDSLTKLGKKTPKNEKKQ